MALEPATENIKANPVNGPVNSATVKNHIDFLASDALKGRQTGSSGIKQAADYAVSIFKNSGVLPFYAEYQDNFEVDGAKAFNLVGKVYCGLKKI